MGLDGMKVLIIKTTSLGDVIHTLPALTDAGKTIPGIRFDWVVEQPFAEIPAWHPLVDKVIPVAVRRWRKQPLQAIKSAEWQQFYASLRSTQYDLVIDAQGLVKSALLARLAPGKRAGLNFRSAWEPVASLLYNEVYAVNPEQHAVARVRQLFAAALGYAAPMTVPDYGLDSGRLPQPSQEYQNYMVFLHGTTWATKHWPEGYWRQLAQRVTEAGYQLLLPWGSDSEQQRAERIAANLANGKVLPKMALLEIAGILSQAVAVIAVDTGLGHLAAALNVPTINLYGPTNPVLTGTAGANQIHLAAPFECAPCLQKECTYKGVASVRPACFAQLPPEKVWHELKNSLNLTSQ